MVKRQAVYPELVGKRIRQVRILALNQTQEKFAKEIGVKKQSYISRYENGRIPSPELLVIIANVGGKSVDWLLTGKSINGCKNA